MNHCASCHGRDRKGDPPNFPSLADITSRMNKETALTKIMQGSGRMPAFSSLLKGKEESIIAYLFDLQHARPSQKEADLFEIHANRSAIRESDNKTDTASVYLNVTPFSHFRDIEGRPAIKPPWGALNAINLNTGDYAWKVSIGNIPELQGKGEPITGMEGYGGPIVTAGGLIFIGGTRDKKFRAFDKDSGELLWETDLPGVANATPCTYWSNGKQFIAVSVSGSEGDPAGSIVTFALP